MSEIKVGDFVVVKSGPAFVEGARNARGRVKEVLKDVVMVHVASGGLWGFMAVDLRVLPK